jgi:hypothetical protein
MKEQQQRRQINIQVLVNRRQHHSGENQKDAAVLTRRTSTVPVPLEDDLSSSQFD